MKTYLLYHQLGNTVKADIALNNLALCFAVWQLLVGAKALFQVFNFGDGSPNVMANSLAELSSRFKNFSRIYWLKLLKDGSATFPPKTPTHSLRPRYHEHMISIESPPWLLAYFTPWRPMARCLAPACLTLSWLASAAPSAAA